MFIFFGHYTLTIPPPSWTNNAHKHGVKMLGTLIFEQWDDVKAIGRAARHLLTGKVCPDSSTPSSNEELALE